MQGRVLGGRYRLLSPLGQGGMGAVWRAQQLDLLRPVAIKLINPSDAGSTQNRLRFEREARAAAELTSLHIVDITDYGIDNDTPYIVMKLLEGESLAARLIRRGKLPFEETVCLLSQVAKALTLAHGRQIVHRDLKPENVFIEGYQADSEGAPGNPEVVKVLDFGIAKVLGAKSLGSSVGTCTEAPIGTPYYMSPEQIVDSSRVDHRTDIWSFGVLAYQCVTGRRPFDASSLALLWDAIRSHAARPPSEVAVVPTGFDEWFAQATACKLEERFDSIREASAQLCALQARRSTPSVGSAAKFPGGVLSAAAKHHGVPGSLPVTEAQKPGIEQVQAAAAPTHSQNTVEPSSVTSPRSRKSASVYRVAAAALLIGGAASGLGYFGYARQNAEAEGSVTSSTAFAATLTAVPEAALPAPQAQKTPRSNDDPTPVPSRLEPRPAATGADVAATGADAIAITGAALGAKGGDVAAASSAHSTDPVGAGASKGTTPGLGLAPSKDAKPAMAGAAPPKPPPARATSTPSSAKSGTVKPVISPTSVSSARPKSRAHDAPF
ncbi:MAG: protein kinase domain-containing protein [Myxococcales bacterium]